MNRSAFVLLCLLASVGAWGQTETVTERLDSTVLSAHRHTSVLSAGMGSSVKVDMASLSTVPSILGNADPIRFLTALPGVETGSELDAGLHVQGSETSHSLVTMDGAPVYGAKHLLGIFSVFNAPHFGDMHFSTQASDHNRLGGVVDISLPSNIPARTSMDLSAGIVSSQGTLRQPIGSSSVLSLSGRASYLNLLYKGMVNVDGDPVYYDFGDLNLSFVSHLSKQDELRLNVYGGSDRVDFSAISSEMQLRAGWQNSVASAMWKHGSMVQELYYSRYALDMDFCYSALAAKMPSNISTLGYYGSWDILGVLNASLRSEWHQARPQDPQGEGEKQSALESSLALEYEREIAPALSGSLSLRGTHYLSPERKNMWALSPSVMLSYDFYRYGKLDLRAGAQKQYLFQTGLTSLGFPCEFWFLAGKHADPQSSLYGTLSYKLSFARDMYALKFEAYYRSLEGQVEYIGDIFDVVNTDYSLDKSIINGSGRNFGASVLLHKQAGKLTGWLGYSFGRSLRSFDRMGYSGEYPSNHERMHELNLVLNWTERKWSAGLSFVGASGTPFTAPDSFYLLGGRLISHYNGHNGNRLEPYARMDLSFNWYFIKEASRSFGLNLSVYNATMRENQLFCRLNYKDGKFAYSPLSLTFSILPSIGIFYRI